MLDLLNNIYGQIAAFLVAVGVLWSGTKAFGALRKWMMARLKPRLDARKERRELPAKTFAMLQAIKSESEKMDAQQGQQLDALSHEIQTVKDRLEKNGDQTSTLQCEKLNWGYVFYGKQHHPIPMQTLISLEKMYKQYKGDLPEGQERNHVPVDWLDVIHTAPIAEA